MLYVIYGKDTKTSHKKLTELVDSLQKKRPDASLFRLNAENWSTASLDELLQSQGLFLPKYIIVLDQLLSQADSSEVVGEKIEELAKSEHICILFEEKIKAADLKKLEKHAEKVSEYDEPVSSKKEFPKTFALADAIALKETKQAWIIFVELMSQGTAAEEIQGVLWWQFKSIVIAQQSRSVKESGLSPYVYQKALRASAVWKNEELDAVIDRLFLMYHKAHRGEIDFMMELERFMLSPVEKGAPTS